MPGGGTTPTVGSVFQVLSDTSFTDYVHAVGDGTAYANSNSITGEFVLGTITVVPEPGTLVLLCSGGLALLFLALRRRATAG